MNSSEMKVYRERLINLRARLRGDVHAMADAALNKTRAEASGDLSLMPIHMADVGTDNYEQEFTLSLLQKDEGKLQVLVEGLQRFRIEGWTSRQPPSAPIATGHSPAATAAAGPLELPPV